MKKKLLFAAGLFLLQLANAQVSGIEWQKSYNSYNPSNIDMYYHGNASGDGLFFTQNYSDYPSPQYGILTKTTLTGNLLWNKEFLKTNLEHATNIYDIQSTNDGYVLAGRIVPKNDNDSFANQGRMIKVDEDGNILWIKNYPISPGTNYISISKVIATQDNGFLLGGYINKTNDDYDFFILKTDADGIEQWRKTYGGSKDDFLDDLAINSEGNIYLSGKSQSTDGDVSNGENVDSTYATWVVKISSTGTILWEKAFEGASHDYPYARITDTADNGCAIIYMQTKHDASGIEITKFQSNGVLQWQNDYTPDTFSWNELNIIKSTNGQIVFGSGGSFLKGLNLNGNILWSWQNPDTTYELQDGELTQTPDNGYLFTGKNMSEGKIDAIKLAPEVTLSANESTHLSENKIYPNPSNGNFKINSKDGKISSIKISDASGKNVYTETLKTSKNQFHLGNHLTNGVYFVEVLFENNKKETKKLIIKK